MAEAATTSRRLPYVAAITDGVRAVLKEFDNSFVIGEDVAGAGSVYGYSYAYGAGQSPALTAS